MTFTCRDIIPLLISYVPISDCIEILSNEGFQQFDFLIHPIEESLKYTIYKEQRPFELCRGDPPVEFKFKRFFSFTIHSLRNCTENRYDNNYLYGYSNSKEYIICCNNENIELKFDSGIEFFNKFGFLCEVHHILCKRYKGIFGNVILRQLCNGLTDMDIFEEIVDYLVLKCLIMYGKTINRKKIIQ